MDGKNAFNSANKYIAMDQILQHFPTLLPLVRQFYDDCANMWFCELSDGMRAIRSYQGFQQGDPIGTWAYSMVIQPFIEKIQQIIGPSNFVNFFVDDGNIVADTEKMIEALTYIFQDGSKYGYNLKLNSGTYLMGKCGNLSLAEQKKKKLIDLGISENIIFIHLFLNIII